MIDSFEEYAALYDGVDINTLEYNLKVTKQLNVRNTDIWNDIVDTNHWLRALDIMPDNLCKLSGTYIVEV